MERRFLLWSLVGCPILGWVVTVVAVPVLAGFVEEKLFIDLRGATSTAAEVLLLTGVPAVLSAGGAVATRTRARVAVPMAVASAALALVVTFLWVYWMFSTGALA